MEKLRQEMLDMVKALGLATVGEPVFAFFDPPWTPPFMRRNEVMIEVAAR